MATAPASIGLPAPDLLDRFHETAARHPRRGAVVAPDGEVLDFATLTRRVRGLAAALTGAGVRPGHLVGVALPRDPALVTALLATWQVGAGYVPLDPAYPQDRLDGMVADGGVTVVIGDPADRPVWSAGVRILPPTAAPVDGTEPPARTPGSAVAYVIYTSGSTGRPKGVGITREAAAHLVSALEEGGFYAASPGRIAWNASVSFDASVQQWVRVCRGDTLLLMSEEQRADPSALADHLLKQGATDLDTTPSHWSLLRDCITEAAAELPGGLRLFVGGEPILDAMWRDLAHLREADTIQAFNLYGPTECTVDSTVAHVTGSGPHIGRPLPHTGAHVLDDALSPTDEGELYLTGPALARGYLGRPGLTAERFTACPFGPPGARMYRTGDLVRLRPDGALDYRGRGDHQVKVNGFRIELGEIETVLAGHPAVAAAIVVVREYDDQAAAPGRSLAAYWVPAPGTERDAEPLRRHLRSRLPDPMVPVTLTPLEALPLGVGGKVDRSALPAPAEQAGDQALQDENPEPTGELEVLLAESWQEVLGREKVWATDDFFALGGHSLVALRVVANLRKQLGVVIRTRLVYQHPRLRGLARAIADGDDHRVSGEAR